MDLDTGMKAKIGAAVAVVVAGVIGFAVGGSGGDSASAQIAGNFGPGQGMQQQGQSGSSGATGATGQAGSGGPGGGQGGPGQMTEVTGDAATKAKKAALAKVSGTADHVVENPQGDGYMVMVRSDDGTMTMVQVSDDFAVTGTQEMGAPPNGGQGGSPSGTSNSQSGS